MSATVRLLQVASKILGGDQALAKYLGIPETVLPRYIDDPAAFPDALLLRTIDLIEADREGMPIPGPPDAPALDALLERPQ
jgi:hypothetical protein